MSLCTLGILVKQCNVPNNLKPEIEDSLYYEYQPPIINSEKLPEIHPGASSSRVHSTNRWVTKFVKPVETNPQSVFRTDRINLMLIKLFTN